MSKDLEIIKELEKQIGKKLKRKSIDKIRYEKGCAIDENEKVLGLNLWGVELSDISPLKELTNLTELNLSGNKISDISGIKELTNLTHLDLHNNQISDISGIKELTNLTYLNLAANQISNISSIKELANLTHLELKYNQISDISGLKELTNLTRVDLSYNQISDISPITELTNLTHLDLRYNELSRLPREIVDSNMDIKWEYSPSQGINLGQNYLESPPMEIVKKGKKAVKAWFESLEEEEKKALNEVKLLLVGDGGAGKTSLVKQLLKKGFDEKEPQTDGINITQWNITAQGNNQPVKVNIWDFGGQEVMHATHQFFLSKRSLYIIVLDGRKDEKVEYWLKHVKSFGSDSPILMVLNKIDQNPGFDVNRLFLQKKYPNIRGFFPLSCATVEGIQTFSQHLTKELAKVEMIGITWPQSWFNIKTQLENMKKDFISYDEYKDLCQKEHILQKTSRETLVEFLHDLGVVLHFKDFKLRATHVLNPEWVTNAVYKIINSKQVADAKGLLKLDQLEEILLRQKDDKYDYPSDKHRFIIELMQKFELCYEVDRETILVPDLLAVPQPEFQFDYATALKFRVDYEFLPRSIMPRFIVKMHNDIIQELRWRTGVVLEDTNFACTAVVIADIDAGRIYIYVQGQQKRDYLAAILFTLRTINKSFEKLDAVEKVPMPDDAKITVSYKHLLRLEQKGTPEYMPDGSDKEYNVKDLLGTIHIPIEKKNEEEILQILRKLKEKSDTEETLLQKANDIFEIKPSLLGIGININSLIGKLFKRK